MKVCIHRGTREVGGTCIEIESQGKRIALDVGLPLEATDSIENLPKVKGFLEQDESLLAVAISHPHLDHYGLAHHLLSGTRMLMGAATEKILEASTVFTPTGMNFGNVLHLETGKPISIGPFTITPYLNDHSAYDAYSLLISADGQRLFYSGDFRGHGRKASTFERFLKHPPSEVDVLLMEGTTIGRSGSEAKFKTEQELEQCFLEHIRDCKAMVLVWTSGQNVDRLVTVLKACRKSGRQLILDMYTAEILRVTGNSKLPQADWKGIKVFLPDSQKRQIIKKQQFKLADRYKPYRIYPKQLAAQAARSVMLFRPSMVRDLEKAECLQDARLVYSLWPGYLKRKDLRSFYEWLNKRGIPLVHCHTSGHASPQDLQRFAKAIAPKMLAPIHSFATKRFKEYFENVEMKKMANGGRCPMPDSGILAGADTVINKALELERNSKYQHKRSWQLLSKKTKLDFDGKALIEEILALVKSNWHKEKSHSHQNWRWEPKAGISPRNKSAEVVLERRIIHTGGKNWTNQVPVASGLTQFREGRRAIDLVHRCGNGWYEFIELKVNEGAGTPLFAAMEILQYGVLYIFSRENALTLGYDVTKNELLRANGIHLKVQAPITYYKGCDLSLSQLENCINIGLSKFLAQGKRGFKMDFKFEPLS